MPKGQISRSSKEKQDIDAELLYCENFHIIECYNHFKDRYSERYVKKDCNSKLSKLTYESYWNDWVKNLRGDFLYYDNGRMVRLIGNYIKDSILYRVIYTKNDNLNIFVPLTIVDVSNQKKKLILYKKLLSVKKNKNDYNSNS